MKLIKIFGQQSKANPDKIESSFMIEVEYDEKTNTVTEIIGVWAYNAQWKLTTPLDQIMVEQMSEAFEVMISKIDWRELYREQRVDKKAA